MMRVFLSSPILFSSSFSSSSNAERELEESEHTARTRARAVDTSREQKKTRESGFCI